MTKKKQIRKPTNYGEVLLYEFMEPYGIEVGDLADLLGVHYQVAAGIVNSCCMDVHIARQLGSLFGTTPEFWLNLKNKRLLWESRQKYPESEMPKQLKKPKGVKID